jgi:hypothetical protein
MYATVADVERYVPARAPFQANTKPSATQVAALITDATADIEGVLAEAGYSLPIATTATQAFQIVQAACAKCAAELVERVAPTSNRVEHYAKMCSEAKKMLAAGKLPGVDLGTDTGQARYSPTEATAPIFTRDMEL